MERLGWDINNAYINGLESNVTYTPFFLIIFPLIFSAVLVWSVLSPNREQFAISKNIITVVKGRKPIQVEIPLKVTLIISYADICPPFARRSATSMAKQSYSLRGKYAVSILQKMPLEFTLQRLHQNLAKRYTNSSIQNDFGNKFIYSFVCDQILLNQLLDCWHCFVVIPKSLTNKVFLNSQLIEVFIDPDY